MCGVCLCMKRKIHRCICLCVCVCLYVRVSHISQWWTTRVTCDPLLTLCMYVLMCPVLLGPVRGGAGRSID